MKPCGFIYITTHLVDGKRYVGKCSYGKRNWETYLGSGIRLRRAISKYGKEQFRRDIIEECATIDILNERERYWIDYYDAVRSDSFYNIASGGDGGNVIAGYTEEERQKYSMTLSAARRGRVNIGKNNHCAKAVICLNDMRVFPSGGDAARFYGANYNMVQQCCNPACAVKTAGHHPVTGERLLMEYYDPKKEYVYCPYDPHKKRRLRVVCLNTRVVFASVQEASEFAGVAKNTLLQCVAGKTYSAGRDKISGERLYWMRWHDGLNDFEMEQELEKRRSHHQKKTPQKTSSNPNYRNRAVRCIETGEVFETVTSAAQWCGLRSIGGVSASCRQPGYSGGKHPDTHKKLHWEYVTTPSQKEGFIYFGQDAQGNTLPNSVNLVSLN